MRKNVIIRRTTEGVDRSASSYVIRRSEPVGRSVAAPYRFAKTSLQEAERFDKKSAQKILTSLRRSDEWREYSTYTLVQM